MKALLDSVFAGPGRSVLPLEDPGHGVVGQPRLPLHHEDVTGAENESGRDGGQTGASYKKYGGEAEADGEKRGGEVVFTEVGVA